MTNGLPRRSPRIVNPAGLEPRWRPTCPEFSCAANAVSLMMPYVEPYVTRSTRAYLGELEEPLATTARQYIAQETQHHVQHRRFNDALRNRYWGVPTLELVIGSIFEVVETRSSARFNLAFAAGSEAVAYNAARWVSKRHRGLFDGADIEAQELFVWHLAEEVEHKSVAFDVYEAAGGGRLRYLRAMVLAFVLLGVFAAVGTCITTIQERVFFHPRAWLNLTWWSFSFMFEALPNMAMSATSGHHPTQLVDPSWFSEWLADIDAQRALGDPLGSPAGER